MKDATLFLGRLCAAHAIAVGTVAILPSVPLPPMPWYVAGWHVAVVVLIGQPFRGLSWRLIRERC